MSEHLDQPWLPTVDGMTRTALVPEQRYRICTVCVMDTTDPSIRFDAAGVCNHCATVEAKVRNRTWFPQGGELRLAQMLATVRRRGRGRAYDCVIGLSGGADSSYIAWLAATQWKLRTLAVHVDTGWNSEIAVGNVERIVRRLGLDLHTQVIHWPTMQSLQRAYFLAGVYAQDAPQDHAIFSVVREATLSYGVKSFLSGVNPTTESIGPRSDMLGYSVNDSTNLRAIFASQGAAGLDKFPIMSFARRYLWLPYGAGVQVYQPLSFMPFERTKVQAVITDALGWRDYGGKHHESRWTRYYQSYYLPVRFGIDKRRAHLASLIVAGQMPREVALAYLEKPPFDPRTVRLDEEYIMKKLGLSHNQYASALRGPIRREQEWPNEARLLSTLMRVRDALAKLRPR